MKLFAEVYLDEDVSALVAVLLDTFPADDLCNQLLYV